MILVLWGIIVMVMLNLCFDDVSLVLVAKVFCTGLFDYVDVVDIGYLVVLFGVLYFDVVYCALVVAGVEVLLGYCVELVDCDNVVTVGF